MYHASALDGMHRVPRPHPMLHARTKCAHCTHVLCTLHTRIVHGACTHARTVHTARRHCACCTHAWCTLHACIVHAAGIVHAARTHPLCTLHARILHAARTHYARCTQSLCMLDAHTARTHTEESSQYQFSLSVNSFSENIWVRVTEHSLYLSVSDSDYVFLTLWSCCSFLLHCVCKTKRPVR